MADGRFSNVLNLSCFFPILVNPGQDPTVWWEATAGNEVFDFFSTATVLKLVSLCASLRKPKPSPS